MTSKQVSINIKQANKQASKLASSSSRGEQNFSSRAGGQAGRVGTKGAACEPGGSRVRQPAEHRSDGVSAGECVPLWSVPVTSLHCAVARHCSLLPTRLGGPQACPPMVPASLQAQCHAWPAIALFELQSGLRCKMRHPRPGLGFCEMRQAGAELCWRCKLTPARPTAQERPLRSHCPHHVVPHALQQRCRTNRSCKSRS